MADPAPSLQPPITSKTVPPLAGQICFALYSASLAISRLYAPMLEQLRLTYPQYLVMVALWHQDRISVGQLGAQLRLESNTLTPLLKRMQAAGLLARKRSAEDERQVLVTLSDEGRALQARAAEFCADIHEALGIGAAALTQLQCQLSDLRDRIETAQVTRLCRLKA